MATSITKGKAKAGEIEIRLEKQLMEMFLDQVESAGEIVAGEFTSSQARFLLSNKAELRERFGALVRELGRTSEFVRTVRVNRELTPEAALRGTEMKSHFDSYSLQMLPLGSGDKVEQVFFRPGRKSYVKGLLGNQQLLKEYEIRGLDPDPRALLVANGSDHSLARLHRNATIWIGKNGAIYHATFRILRGVVVASVFPSGRGEWDGSWLFAGKPKVETRS